MRGIVYSSLSSLILAEQMGEYDCKNNKEINKVYTAKTVDPEVERTYRRAFTSCKKSNGGKRRYRKKTQRRKKNKKRI
jgi:hypothetical protein